MSLVVCKLPKAGLGNQLFPLMSAFVFANLNGLEVIVVGYHQLKLGPYLRNEKSKRRYSGYFNFQKNIVGEYLDILKVLAFKKRYNVVYDPSVAKLAGKKPEHTVFIFGKLPNWRDYYRDLRDHRAMVLELLYPLLNPWIIKEVENATAPVIGMHIRMGDFRKLKEGEAFKGGPVRTPESYFVDLIQQARAIYGQALPVSLFTDGHKHEFKELFELENINLIEGNADIVDMLLLSRSKIILSSSGSTFSNWAGFIADAPFIRHPDHIHNFFRPSAINALYYEGAMVKGKIDPLLKKNILDIQVNENPKEVNYV
ncbi:MAG: hypothetical protein ABIN36_06535 [Ferruginibacter sp.]